MPGKKRLKLSLHSPDKDSLKEACVGNATYWDSGKLYWEVKSKGGGDQQFQKRRPGLTGCGGGGKISLETKRGDWLKKGEKCDTKKVHVKGRKTPGRTVGLRARGREKRGLAGGGKLGGGPGVRAG